MQVVFRHRVRGAGCMAASGWLGETGTGGARTGVVYHIAIASHSAAEGLLGLISDMAHVVGLAVWGGGLVYFAVSRWPKAGSDDEQIEPVEQRKLAVTADRFSVDRRRFRLSHHRFRCVHVVSAHLRHHCGDRDAVRRRTAEENYFLAMILAIAAVNYFYFVPQSCKKAKVQAGSCANSDGRFGQKSYCCCSF